MQKNKEFIENLSNKIELLHAKQIEINIEFENLKKEIELLKNENTDSKTVSDLSKPNLVEEIIQPIEISKPTDYQKEKSLYKPVEPISSKKEFNYFPKIDTEWEKFIGENLLNKIGILAVVVGVGIGAKYAIEHEMISPLTRIILGYVMGFGLMGFAFYLKKNYENFSSVLLSGAMAILYIITFIAYSFYQLIPQNLTFAMMVGFTIFTVLAASHYQRQIIALLGLVGAYAVPFLLSNETGNILFLFTYITIINIGILILSFIKNWKWLNISAFVFTWFIYFSIFETYLYKDKFHLLFGFLLVFFILFYITLLAYKFYKNEKFEVLDILFLLANSFIFFGAGYALWYHTAPWDTALGIFSLANAIIHFIVSFVVFKRQFSDKNMFHLVVGLVFIFLTITIPVQLDGNWVTLLWIFEAVLLYWIGAKNNINFYKKLSYPLVYLSFISLLIDWWGNHFSKDTIPLINLNFISGVLYTVALSFYIYWFYENRKTEIRSSKVPISGNFLLFSYGIILLSALYFTFRLEIESYWDFLYYSTEKTNSADNITYFNHNLSSFKKVWIINYSVIFFALLTYINHRFLKNKLLGIVFFGLGVISIFSFLSQGLIELNGLQNAFNTKEPIQYFSKSNFMIGIRYVSFSIIGISLWVFYKFFYSKSEIKYFAILFDLLLHITILRILSNELIQTLLKAGYIEVYKSGLSILWGVYAFIFISYGIWKKKKHIRIGAMLLFAITLIKLVFYDLSHLETIPKTIVFVLLGVLLLIISFLYNKFKHFIADEN